MQEADGAEVYHSEAKNEVCIQTLAFKHFGAGTSFHVVQSVILLLAQEQTPSPCDGENAPMLTASSEDKALCLQVVSDSENFLV